MRKMSWLALSAALILSASATAKSNGTADPAQQPAAKSATADKKICKRLPASGTRMEERVCLTKAEWKKVEEEVRQ